MKQKFLNIVPDSALIGTIVGAYLLDGYVPIIKLIKPPLGYVGALLIIVGFVFVAKTITLLRKRASSDVVHTSNILITNGLFALSRNPLYASELLIVTGVAIILGSLSAFAAPVVYLVIVGGFVIPFEEGQLRRKFGLKYEAYMRSVRRWI